MGKLFWPQGGWRMWMRRAMGSGVLLLASCGGGAGGPGGGGDSQAGVGSGGTGSYSNGSITAFGSIVVNGVHYDHTSAVSITKVGDAKGATHVADDLKRGMMVEVDVTPVAQGKKLSISYGGDLLGTVDSINLSSQSLTVMGQVVSTFDEGENKRTRFGDDLNQEHDHLADLNLHVGDVVEVYGYEDPSTGAYIATRIERKPSDYDGAYVVRGVVENLSSDKRSCDIGRQHIAYVSSGSLDTEALANGLVARVEVTPVPGASWYAVGMTLNKPLPQADRGDAAISGLVTKVTGPSTTRFSVNGVPVDASLMGTCPACVATPSLGAALSVKGSFVNGVIMATEVKPLLP